MIDSGLFKDRGGFGSDDRVRGLVGGTPFEAAEVSRRYRTGRKNTDTTIIVFHGLFMRLATDAGVSGPVIVEPESPGRVQLGDRFGAGYQPRSTIRISPESSSCTRPARSTRGASLTPAMRNGLLAVRRQAQHPVFVAFHKDRVYVAVNYGRALFEPAVAATTSVEAIEEIANHFGVAEFVARELELQSRGESAGAAPMWEPDVETARSRLTGRLTSGSLTEAQLLEVGFALDGTSYDTKHEEAVSRPADSQVEIRNDGRGVTISYGLPLSYFLVIAISLVAALVATAAARTVAQTTSLGPLTSFAARVPEMPRLDELIAHFPLVWMIGGLLVWAALTFWWLQRVRRVDIEADAVKKSIAAFVHCLAPIPGRRTARSCGSTTASSSARSTASPRSTRAPRPCSARNRRRAGSRRRCAERFNRRSASPRGGRRAFARRERPRSLRSRGNGRSPTARGKSRPPREAKPSAA